MPQNTIKTDSKEESNASFFSRGYFVLFFVGKIKQKQTNKNHRNIFTGLSSLILPFPSPVPFGSTRSRLIIRSNAMADQAGPKTQISRSRPRHDTDFGVTRQRSQSHCDYRMLRILTGKMTMFTKKSEGNTAETEILRKNQRRCYRFWASLWVGGGEVTSEVLGQVISLLLFIFLHKRPMLKWK